MPNTPNTKIYLWFEPLASTKHKSLERIYINCIIKGNYSHYNTNELEDLLSGSIMNDIMDFTSIHTNNNYGVISCSKTNSEPSIEYTISPQDKAIQIKRNKIISSPKPIPLTNKNISIGDNGIINISIPDYSINQDFDFLKIWKILRDNIQNKISEGDNILITDDDNNTLIEILGGSYLNIGISDVSVYDKNETQYDGLKGGLFVRSDGSFDIGDINRTFYVKIHTNNLLKSSLKLNQPISGLLNSKIKLL